MTGTRNLKMAKNHQQWHQGMMKIAKFTQFWHQISLWWLSRWQMKLAFTQISSEHSKIGFDTAVHLCVCVCMHANCISSYLPHSGVVFSKDQIPIILQPPYFPDLTICDVWFFQRFKTGLKGPCFAPKQCDRGLTAVPKEVFQICFQQCQDWKTKHESAEWQYCKGD